MEKSRALEILKQNSNPFNVQIKLTKEEVNFVNSVWDRMSGNTSFTDALVRISKGNY
jgi:hypothetical protein